MKKYKRLMSKELIALVLKEIDEFTQDRVSRLWYIPKIFGVMSLYNDPIYHDDTIGCMMYIVYLASNPTVPYEEFIYLLGPNKTDFVDSIHELYASTEYKSIYIKHINNLLKSNK